MHTKYRNGRGKYFDEYLGPINPMPDHLFNNVERDFVPGFDANNNANMVKRSGYEFRTYSERSGFIRFLAGHMKHIFTARGRPITCYVCAGELKIKCESRKRKLVAGDVITVKEYEKVAVKNNSLRNTCVLHFRFENATATNETLSV